jgi:hypothetical protein
MRNRTPYPSRRSTLYRQQRHLTKPRFSREPGTGRSLALLSCRYSRTDGPLTYQQVEELVRERGAVEFPRYKQLFDLAVQNLSSSMALQLAHEPGVFDGDVIIFSALPDERIPSSPPLESLAALCCWAHYRVLDRLQT